MKNYLFTSESVSEGHPDKVADQISDAVLDAYLELDPKSKVACETLVTTGLAVVAGEIRTQADPRKVDVQQIARDTILKIGYDDAAKGYDGKTCGVLVTLHGQSDDIFQGVNEQTSMSGEQGAGDQGLMFGYASNETTEFMPLSISLSHKLLLELSKARHSNRVPCLFNY